MLILGVGVLFLAVMGVGQRSVGEPMSNWSF